MNYVITYTDDKGTEFKTTVFAFDPRQAIRLFHRKVPDGIVTKAIPEALIDPEAPPIGPLNSASMSKPDARACFWSKSKKPLKNMVPKHLPWHPGVFQHSKAVTSIKEAHKVGDCTLSIDGIKEQMPPKEMQKVANS